MNDTDRDVVALTQLVPHHPGVKFDLATSVLRHEADAGRVGILN